MNPSELRPGIYRVKHTDESGSIEMNLSVRDCLGLNFVAGFFPGEKPPRKGKHKMMTANVRQWIERMEILP